MSCNRWLVALGLAVPLSSPGPVAACTIVVLTDGQRVLFCNNEDWSNPNTRIWFVPGEGGHGCAFVGFDDGWAQGGVNTEGLAFDQTCGSVDEAVAFYERHQEPGFGYAKVLVAERSGASAVIGARDGRLHVERRTRSRAFGYGADIASRMIEGASATMETAARILRAARQEGRYPTQYSNVFDLRRGEIVVFRFQDSEAPVRLSLLEELARPAHAFDIASLWHSPAKPR